MHNFVSDRFKSERKRLNLSQEGLGNLIEVSESTVKRWENGASIPSDKLILCAQHGFDITYVLLGDRNNEQSKSDELFCGEFALVNVYDVDVSAGDGAVCFGAAEPVSRLAFRKDWLSRHGLYAKDLAIVYAKGDSMEPTIHDKEPLLVNISDKELTDGFIYVVRNQENFWVKRVQRQFNELLLLSDNEKYLPMKLDLNESTDIEIIGRWIPPSRGTFY